ncbi:MAG TPA: cytochrome c [Fimbriimonadaceae bacterium]|nr:cytochrome c [Fimbriimonadaceae bacterium]
MKKARVLRFVCYAVFAFAVVGCHPDMWIQPKFKAQAKDDFFSDHSSSRLPVKGTVPFGEPPVDSALQRGYKDGKLVRDFPIPVTMEMIKRGEDRFNVFCKHCHGAAGDGTGMISQRGFDIERPIANYQTERLRKMPVGHFFDVITNGYGAMFPYSDRISVEDRWAIVAYIRVLQLSQNATLKDVPKDLQPMMDDPEGQLKKIDSARNGGGPPTDVSDATPGAPRGDDTK